ncbi:MULTISPECIES: hypothetical protein [Elizabethkingia]|uniref:hypothetical protein n=1 Tax=Elizabethkingia TaxID=308865 RepID=UPI0021A8755E|nr:MULTISPECIES: hypothetical protein [Elizabethkingia]MCT3689552.1 hypothetical protein [Elizabethkingia anophelis]MCT3713378.1 hypothetical protein [Elizabethkingia anophelis]MCT3716796.1 hypothetical protein [Elizabethkingia anophelis]MCT3730445.1 hypothetical protein [Elizabethkingia anophelis]MCT3739092.1 hypothetical protein [Elizabethkingia anophelis]
MIINNEDYKVSNASSSYTKVSTETKIYTIGNILTEFGFVTSFSEGDFLMLKFFYKGRLYSRKMYDEGKYFTERSTSIHAGKFARQIKNEVDNGK